MVIATLLQAAADPPAAFVWVALGWAVGVTTFVSGAVLSGKLTLGREVEAQRSTCASERTLLERETATYRELYSGEKAGREKAQNALDGTMQDLRLQNQTLAAAVDLLQPPSPHAKGA